MEENKVPNLSEKVDELYNLIKENPKIIKKKIRIPRKAKVKKNKIKKGWVGILKVDENGNLSGERTKIEGSAFNTSDGSYHASDGREVLFYQGKYPVLIQPTWKSNPLLIRSDSEKNETYGHKYIMALMSKDQLTPKKKGIQGGALIWIVLAIVGFFLISKFLGKGGV